MLQGLIQFGAVIPFALCLAHAQDVTGDWLGAIPRPSGDMRIALHITKVETGLKATLDAVDQGVKGVPINSIKLAESKLTFDLPAFQASYEGNVDGAGTAIEGVLAGAEGAVPMTLRRGTVAKVQHKPAKPSDIDGDWTGTLSVGERQDYWFHISNTEDGLIVAMDLPAQNIQGVEASSVKRSDSSISLEWKVFGSRFEGKIAEDRSAIEGAVTQAGMSFPFTLKRAKP